MLKTREARTILISVGCVSRKGKGSHEIWRHPAQPQARIVLSGHDGDDVHHYQATRIRNLQALLRQQKECVAR